MKAWAGARSGGRPRVLAVLPHLIPSAMIGVVKPLTALHQARRLDASVVLEHWVSRRQIERADLVVFCRNVEPAHGGALEAALAARKPVIYELDDDFFTIAPSSEVGRYLRAPARLAQLERYIRAASLVRVYSRFLEARCKELNPRVRQVQGWVDWSLLPSEPLPRDPDTVRIVYATSRREDELVSLFLDDVVRLLEAYPGRVELFFWGHHPGELRGHPLVHCLEFVRDYDRFFRRFARSGFDIGLAPLHDDVFHRAKTDNKFREYAACRIAGVYSDVEVYADRVRHEETGLLVPPKAGAWFDAVGRLVEDVALRERIQERAYQEARARYTADAAERVWLEQIAEVLGGAGIATAAGDESGEHAQAEARTVRCPGVRGAWARPVLESVRRRQRKRSVGRGVSAARGLRALGWQGTWLLLRLRWRLLWTRVLPSVGRRSACSWRGGSHCRRPRSSR